MTQWNVVSTFVLDQVFGYQTANKMRENSLAIISARLTYHLGGSRSLGIPRAAVATNVPDWIDIEIDGTNGAGLTNQLRVEVRSGDGVVSVTPKLRNVTDASDAGTGVAATGNATDYSGSNQKQTISVTLASGVKKYRLMGTPSANTQDTFAVGYLERFATA